MTPERGGAHQGEIDGRQVGDLQPAAVVRSGHLIGEQGVGVDAGSDLVDGLRNDARLRGRPPAVTPRPPAVKPKLAAVIAVPLPPLAMTRLLIETAAVLLRAGGGGGEDERSARVR